VRQTIIGLLMVAVTAAFFYWKATHRYRCPFCGRFVQYNDVNCPHCGNDMEFKHRAGPEALPRAASDLRRRPTRGGRSSRH
jgi:DNA-directed RNA polymerase subunit RPC12/RpoP